MSQGRRAPGGWWRAAPLAPGVFLLLLAGASSSERAPRRHLVEIQGMTFHPAQLELRRGDTVVWVNRDMVPHTATGTSQPKWSTATLTQGQRGQHVPHESGTTPYICALHPVMQGTLIVR